MSTERENRVARLASALQDCFDAAGREAAREIKNELVPRLDKQDATIRQMREHMDDRLDKQDATLRMVWKQVKGNGKLPIDD